LVVLTKGDFLHLIQQYPKVAELIAKTIEERKINEARVKAEAALKAKLEAERLEQERLEMEEAEQEQERRLHFSLTRSLGSILSMGSNLKRSISNVLSSKNALNESGFSLNSSRKKLPSVMITDEESVPYPPSDSNEHCEQLQEQ
jgi:hypothetical protein